MLDEDLVEEDEVGFNGERDKESPEKNDQRGYRGSSIQNMSKVTILVNLLVILCQKEGMVLNNF